MPLVRRPGVARERLRAAVPWRGVRIDADGRAGGGQRGADRPELTAGRPYGRPRRASGAGRGGERGGARRTGGAGRTGEDSHDHHLATFRSAVIVGSETPTARRAPPRPDHERVLPSTPGRRVAGSERTPPPPARGDTTRTRHARHPTRPSDPTHRPTPTRSAPCSRRPRPVCRTGPGSVPRPPPHDHQIGTPDSTIHDPASPTGDHRQDPADDHSRTGRRSQPGPPVRRGCPPGTSGRAG